MVPPVRVEKYVTEEVGKRRDHVVAVTVVPGCVCIGAYRVGPVCSLYGSENEADSAVPVTAVAPSAASDVCAVGGFVSSPLGSVEPVIPVNVNLYV